jgi:3-oxosteroid 1-dehydrogenase
MYSFAQPWKSSLVLLETKISSWDEEADVVILGSSPGSLVASAFSCDNRLSVILLEKGEKFGGGAAYSAGQVWIPNNHHEKERSLLDSREEAIEYLTSISAGRGSREAIETYVDAGPEMLKYIEENTCLKFDIIEGHADYYFQRGGIKGGKANGRYLAAPLIYAREELGDTAALVRTSPIFPLPVSWAEFRKWGEVPSAKTFDFELIASRKRGDVRGFGGALIAWLVKATILDRKIRALLSTRAVEFIVSDEKIVTGVAAIHGGDRMNFRARKGVILGTGGFEWNAELCRQNIPGPETHPTTPPTNEGDGLLMARELGAATALMDQYLCRPSIRIPGEEHLGKPLYRHVNREDCLPHSVIVNKQGFRFANETFSEELSHNGMRRLDLKAQTYPNVPAYLIFDQDYKDRYHLQSVAPNDYPEWLMRADTIEGLARKAGINAENLKSTVDRFNEFARRGVDPDYSRGGTAYDRSAGDSVEKNPVLGPIERPDFYAVELAVANGGTLGGVVVNKSAQVMDVRGKPIIGLYACSNVVAQLALGQGYNSGVPIGQSMILGYLAAKHLAGK